MTSLRIATRGSKLARWQADRVAALLQEHHDVNIEMVVISTVGDQRRDVPIHSIGGTGVFVKEIQQAVLDGHADLAVHSAKDLPSFTADGLLLAAIPERIDVSDALIGSTLSGLPRGAVVATGSVRRRVQLTALRPDLRFAELRGNIDSRLDRANEFAAIVLASAGIERIGRAHEISERLTPEIMLSQVGQGALAVECRVADVTTIDLIAAINDATHHRNVTAERAFLAGIGGGCDAPVAAHAHTIGVTIILDALVADASGSLHRYQASGQNSIDVGREAAAALVAHSNGQQR